MSAGMQQFPSLPPARSLPVISTRGPAVSPPAATSRRHWQRALAVGTVGAVLLLSPLPRASNQPQAMMLWSALIALAAALIAGRRPPPRLTPPAGWLLSLGGGLAVMALFQALPLPGWRGGLPVQTPAGELVLASLSFAPGASLIAALRIAGYLIFFLIVLGLAASRRRARALGNFAFWLVAAQAAWACTALLLLGDIAPHGEKTAYAGMATGSFVNRNSLASYLGMGLVLGVALHLRPARRRRGRWRPEVLALAVILLALLLTQSRMGIAASLAAAGVVLLRAGLSRARLLRLAVVPPVAGLALWSAGLLERLAEAGLSDTARPALYRQVLGMIGDRPLTGFGFDSFPLVYQMYHAPPVPAGVSWENAHSSYLTLWVEGGLVAGSLPLLAGLIAGRALWRRAGRAAPGQSMALAGLGALTLAGLHASVDFSFEIPANAFLLLTLVGLGLGAGPTERGQDP